MALEAHWQMYNVFHVVDDVENMAVQRDGGFVVVVVGYKRVSNIATVCTKNEPNRLITKYGVDTPSEPNSEIPTDDVVDIKVCHCTTKMRPVS